MTLRDWPGGTYLEVRETGKKITTNVLSWIYEHGAKHSLYMRVQINGTWHSHGDEQFAQHFPSNDR